MHITETRLARQHMTPESRALFRDSTLDTRLGRGTVAGALNDQVRFRFDKSGAPSTWSLVPDNELSAKLLASPAGPKLEGKLRSVLASTDRAHGRGLLEAEGIMLSPDAESWAAGYQLMMRDAGVRPMSNRDTLDAARITSEVAGAQAIYGWVQVAPTYARTILTSIGAYSPARGELGARSGRDAEFVGPMLRHELEHRISGTKFDGMADFTTYAPVAWIEEGTATLLHMADPRGERRATEAWGVSARQHAGHVAAPDNFSTGWKPWAPTKRALPDMSATGQANYVDSIGTLTSLLRIAGVDRRTTAGHERTLELLQDVEVRDVPSRLATAILRQRDVRATAERVANLADLIVAANAPDGIERVERFLDRVGS